MVQISYIIILLKSAVPLLLSAMMFFQKVPNIVELKNYKTSLRVLSAAYFLLGATNLIHFFAVDHNTTKFGYLVFSGIYAIVSSFQALLFTYSLIILINAFYVTKKRLIIQLIPIILFCALTITGSWFENYFFLKTIVVLFGTYYFALLIYYTYLFITEVTKFKVGIKDFFSDDEEKRLKWVVIAFCYSLAIGLWALLIILFPQKNLLEIIFSIVCLIFYPYLAFRYMNYTLDFYVLKPVIAHQETKQAEQQPSYPGSRTDFTEKIAKWVGNKSYKKSGITIKELADELCTNRTYLSNHINSTMNTSFCQWLNNLRIEEAQRLLTDNPSLSLKDLAQDLGYKEQAAFSRHFTGIVGTSPSEWKKAGNETNKNGTF